MVFGSTTNPIVSFSACSTMGSSGYSHLLFNFSSVITADDNGLDGAVGAGLTTAGITTLVLNGVREDGSGQTFMRRVFVSPSGGVPAYFHPLLVRTLSLS